MKGYLKIASIMPNIKVGNIKHNLEGIKEEISKANSLGIKLCVFPELSLTGNNLQNLYFDENILKECIESIYELLIFSSEFDMIIIISIPFKYNNCIYETSFVIKSGDILGIVPNNYIDKNDYNFKYFNKLYEEQNVVLKDKLHSLTYDVKFSNDLVFYSDLFSFCISYNSNFDKKNSSLIVNVSSIPETITIDEAFSKIKNFSKETNTAIITSSPGPYESSTNFAYFGRSIIVENGKVISKNDILTNKILIADIDLDLIKKQNDIYEKENNILVNFDFNNYISNSLSEKLYREFDKTPYINKKAKAYNYCNHIINILAVALAKRMNSINVSNIVLGISGGLDSTFALIVAKKTIELLCLSNDNIKAIFLPSFGTSMQSKKIINDLLNSLNINYNEIDISETIRNHFSLINHDINNANVTFENAQARERMQILMDIANDINGIVIGTSDLSEIALGFSTYNGDHMSMYNINGGVPKTLIRYILKSLSDEYIKNENILLGNVLNDILNTPISPELKPLENGILTQKTEEILGNYEIHDFILYYYLNYNLEIDKIYDLAIRTFVYNQNEYIYNDEYIKNCINIFFNRFFKAQYKRTTAPDAPYIGIKMLCDKYKIPNDNEFYLEL